ncbi:glycosyltransferase family 39 protein [Lyngbya aestuarii]|uniref:glycosyltransferase family 39 protein n=1 Tax=Lyngbya aestuarii TaxID=118322 RepID=UPI00403DFD20
MSILHFLKPWSHQLLLLAWIALGAALRFSQLTLKSPWTDEFATIVFSLGNSYQNLPLNQAISLDTLLQPLQVNPDNGLLMVVSNLLKEDHHPPLYFVLAHSWMEICRALGLQTRDLTSLLWAARSLPALFGVVSIPAVYGLGWLAFRSRLVASLAAAMMAVSPYGVYLAQEARHYTLGILWVIASLSCLVVAVQNLKRRTTLPIWVVLSWVLVNSLGIATHYFFSLTLLAEAIVLMGFWIWQRYYPTSVTNSSNSLKVEIPNRATNVWWRIYAAVAGTVAGCFVWLPIFKASYDPQMTQWIMSGVSPVGNESMLRQIVTLISPIVQALATWTTMLCLLPVEATAPPLVIASGMVMLGFLIWALPILYRGFRVQLNSSDNGLAMIVLGGFVLGAIALFFGITYILDADLTRGARYSFVYFPAVIVILAASLAISWREAETVNAQLRTEAILPRKQIRFPLFGKINGKTAIGLIWLMASLSSITVVSNLGYQKYYRPDLLASIVQQRSPVPVLIATTHNTLVQTGEMMGIAWEFKLLRDSQRLTSNPQFLLAHQNQDQCQGTACPASATLKEALEQLPRPLDVWLVNFKAPVTVPSNCLVQKLFVDQLPVDGYGTQLYRCLAADS